MNTARGTRFASDLVRRALWRMPLPTGLSSKTGAISGCALCEDVTGRDEPMTVAVVEPWDPDHPAIADMGRRRREIEKL